MNRRTLMLIATIGLSALFLFNLFSGASALITGLSGLAAGVGIGQAFPSRRAIVRETK